jgi:quercetin dioxygenase-like cupin family protein
MTYVRAALALAVSLHVPILDAASPRPPRGAAPPPRTAQTPPPQTPQTAETVPMSQEPFHRLVFTNDYVAVYDVVLPVGATMKYHEHPTEHLALVIEPGLMKSEVLAQGARDNPTGAAGTVVHIAAGPPHRQTNIGTARLRFMAIELLASPRGKSGANVSATASAAASAASAATSDAKAGASAGAPANAAAAAAGRADGVERRAAPGQTEGCAVALEGEAVRVWRCIVKPGDVSAARTGSGPFLRVAVSPGTFAATAGSAAGRATDAAAGDAAWHEDTSSTAVKNSGRVPFEFVDIEWK